MTDHDPALVEKVATTLWSLECRAAEALHDEPLEVHNGFWRDARAVLDDIADDIARAGRERVEVKAWRAAADKVDAGPTFPLLPSIISGLLREHADALEAHYATRLRGGEGK